MGIPEHPDTQNTQKDEWPRTWEWSRVCEHLALGSIQNQSLNTTYLHPHPVSLSDCWVSTRAVECVALWFGINVEIHYASFDRPTNVGGGGESFFKIQSKQSKERAGCISRKQTPVKPSDWVILRDVYKVCFSYKNELDASEELPLFSVWTNTFCQLP